MNHCSNVSAYVSVYIYAQAFSASVVTGPALRKWRGERDPTGASGPLIRRGWDGPALRKWRGERARSKQERRGTHVY
jgi:hypothetical protein